MTTRTTTSRTTTSRTTNCRTDGVPAIPRGAALRWHTLLAPAIVAVSLAGASGCSLIDRLFLANFDGPYSHAAKQHGGACRDGACQGGECQDGACPDGACRDGACRECQGGACHPRHVGRYGGLARHHLTPEEKMALAGSDYGATAPAGPPTGAVAYPYYTTRGPRDFLAKCPPSIGPQ